MATKTFKNAKKPPSKLPSAKQVDDFVAGGVGTDRAQDVLVRRLSIDMPEDLHTRFKSACALTKHKMAHEIITFIEQRTVELESSPTRPTFPQSHILDKP